MPSFDFTSEADMAALKNAIDVTSRQIDNRFDFKGTTAKVELNEKDKVITLWGDSEGQLWAWCYRIARNKVNDQLRKQASDRLQPMEPEELWQLVETSTQSNPLSAEDRIDLEHALKLLAEAKPECAEYLWQHFVLGLDYSELAEERNMSYDNVRMKIGRCLGEAQALMA